MITRTIRSMMSGAVVMTALLSASSALAHEEELYLPAPDSVQPNDVMDYQADVVSVHTETTGTGATVTTTLTVDTNLLYSIDLVLTCSDDTIISNPVQWWPENTSVSAECPNGAQLVFADVVIRLLK